jgi:hypothetical protein
MRAAIPIAALLVASLVGVGCNATHEPSNDSGPPIPTDAGMKQ